MNKTSYWIATSPLPQSGTGAIWDDKSTDGIQKQQQNLSKHNLI